jgi:hypothetical protein
MQFVLQALAALTTCFDSSFHRIHLTPPLVQLDAQRLTSPHSIHLRARRTQIVHTREEVNGRSEQVSRDPELEALDNTPRQRELVLVPLQDFSRLTLRPLHQNEGVKIVDVLGPLTPSSA